MGVARSEARRRSAVRPLHAGPLPPRHEFLRWRPGQAAAKRARWTRSPAAERRSRCSIAVEQNRRDARERLRHRTIAAVRKRRANAWKSCSRCSRREPNDTFLLYGIALEHKKLGDAAARDRISRPRHRARPRLLLRLPPEGAGPRVDRRRRRGASRLPRRHRRREARRATRTRRARSRRRWIVDDSTGAERSAMVEGVKQYLKHADWRRQHRWRKADLDDDVAPGPDRRPRAADEPPLGRDPPPQDAARRPRPGAGGAEDRADLRPALQPGRLAALPRPVHRAGSTSSSRTSSSSPAT